MKLKGVLPPLPSAIEAPNAAAPTPNDTPTTAAQNPEPSGAPSASTASSTATTELILACNTIDLARRLQSHVKAWAVRPHAGLGPVKIRVVVDPDMPADPDTTWLLSQLAITGLVPPENISGTQIIWKDPE